MSSVSASPEHILKDLSHPFLRLVAGGPDARAALEELSPSPMPEEHELDALEDPQTSLLVLDADGSQRMCLEAAARGNSLVICGAPGTGKTQTVVNLIADSLAKGKRVLCVTMRPTALAKIEERLQQLGLSDFASTLPGTDVAREALAAELTRCLRRAAPPVPAGDGNTVRLRQCRDQLQRYAEALHRLREPLGRSAWSCLCELAALHAVEPGPLGLAPARQDAEAAGGVLTIDEINPAWLEEARQAVQRLQQLWHLRTQAEGPWHGFKAERFTQQLRDEVLALIDRVRSRVDRVLDMIRKFGEQVGVSGPVSLLLQVGELLEAKPPMLPPLWLEETDLDHLARDVEECARQYQQLGQARTPLTERYGPDLWKLPLGTAASVDRAWHAVAPLVAPGDERGAALLSHQQALRGWAADTQKRVPTWIAEARTVEKWIAIPLPAGAGSEAAARTGESKLDPSVTTLRQLLRLANLCQSENPPERSWVDDPAALEEARKLIAENRPVFADYHERRGKLLLTYTDSFFELELERIAAGFAGPYQSWLRFLNGQFRRDRRAIARRTRGALTMPATAAQDVTEAVALLAEKSRLEAEGPRRKPVLGRYEQGLNTDFEAAERGTRVAAEAVELVRKLGCPSLPGRLLDILCAGTPAPEKVRAAAKRLHDSLSAWLQATHGLKAQLPTESLPGAERPLEESALSALNRFARDLQASLNQFGSLTDPVLTQAPARPADTVTLVEDLKRAEEIRSLEGSQESEATRWSKRLGPAFQGLGTDWQALRKSLTWLRKLRDLVRNSTPGATNGGASNGGTAFTQRLARGELPSAYDLRHALEQYQQALHGFENRFESPGPRFEGKRLGEHAPDQVKQRLTTLRDRIAELAGWIDWRHLPDRFGHLGLTAFYAHLLAHPPAAEEILPIFLKSFWQTWWQTAAQQDAALGQFNRDEHERLVAEFCALDREWLKTNAERVRQRAAQHTTLDAASADQLIAQVRQGATLFGQNLDLLLRLKPCIMGSVDAVNRHLPNPPAGFDLVILLEVDQISVDEALPAAGAGRQVVLVGDEQAPPGFAVDGEARGRPTSVLQVALQAGLARRSLRYNYAARHESLVAFANRHFYDDRLISFPTPRSDELRGVHLDHVSEATADAEGANPREAHRVVELVHDHLRNRPELSLGVIALSPAQAALIQAELDERLLKQPALSDVVKREGSDWLFIKSVEHASGAGRDVIVLSIGYAAGGDGRLPKHYGLLSRKDGERWLHPAVTCARHRLLVVSSLRAAQIDVKAKTAPGVVLLRSFLEYAETPFSPTEKGNVHAVAREVARELEPGGHRVVPRVGRSAQPVELAVAAGPSDDFIVAIEFDGPIYEAGTTVRDRERLRAEALQARGWRIHHIWAPAWITHRQEELERLGRVQ